MPYQLVFTQDYLRRALRFLQRHPELKNQYAKTLALLERTQAHSGASIEVYRPEHSAVIQWVRDGLKNDDFVAYFQNLRPGAAIDLKLADGRDVGGCRDWRRASRHRSTAATWRVWPA